MYEKKVKINNTIGLHARPAAEFVDLAKKYKSVVFVENDNKKANASSILTMLTLDAKKGDELTIKAEGIDEVEAVNKLVDFIINLNE